MIAVHMKTKKAIFKLERVYERLLVVSLLVVLLVSLSSCCILMVLAEGSSLKVVVPVKTEAELRVAVSDATEPTTIMLSDDIALTGSLDISANKDITLTSNREEFFKLIGADNASTIVINDGGLLTLAGIRVTHDTGFIGRGVTVSGGKLVLSDGEITGNNGVFGGGVYVFYGSVSMSGGTITNNTVSAEGQTESANMAQSANNMQHSGGMHHSGDMSSDSVVGAGGGVYVGYDGFFSMSGGAIANNTAALDGGGIYVDTAGSFSMSGEGVIANNTATRHGGGAYANTGSFRIAGSAVIANNKATHRGGGVNMNAGPFSMGGGVIANNTAGTGGGVYMSFGSLGIMHGGEISGNTAIGTAEISGGGGVYNEGLFAMYVGVITNNAAYNCGGGVYNNNNFELSDKGEIYDNTALKGNNVYHYNTSMNGYVVPVVTMALLSGITGGIFWYFKNKRK